MPGASDGEKVPAAEITGAYFELGMTFPELYDDSHPEATARNTQKIFRCRERHPDAVEKFRRCYQRSKGNATFAGGQNAQPQFSLFSGTGGDAGATGERR